MTSSLLDIFLKWTISSETLYDSVCCFLLIEYNITLFTDSIYLLATHLNFHLSYIGYNVYKNNIVPSQSSLTSLCFLGRFFFRFLNHSICSTKSFWSSKKKCSFLLWHSASASATTAILKNSLTNFYLKSDIPCSLLHWETLYSSVWYGGCCNVPT